MPTVPVAARGAAAEAELGDRIRKVWKTDIFLSNENLLECVAATIKSNWPDIEGGRGLRLAIVPEAKDLPSGVTFNSKHNLRVTAFPDPNGFMGLFNDACNAVARAVTKLGKHSTLPYHSNWFPGKPSSYRCRHLRGSASTSRERR